MRQAITQLDFSGVTITGRGRCPCAGVSIKLIEIHLTVSFLL